MMFYVVDKRRSFRLVFAVKRRYIQGRDSDDGRQEAEQEVDLRGGTHTHAPDIANGLFTKHVGLSVHILTIFYVRLFT